MSLLLVTKEKIHVFALYISTDGFVYINLLSKRNERSHTFDACMSYILLHVHVTRIYNLTH